MTTPTDEQILKVIALHQPDETYGEMVAIVRDVLALASQPDEPERRACGNCRHDHKSGSDPPCGVCGNTKTPENPVPSWEPKPEEPETPKPIVPDRAGQLFKEAETGKILWPVTHTDMDGYHWLDRPSDQRGTFRLTEKSIQEGKYLRIPHLLPGMKAEECREPAERRDGKYESYYDLSGSIVTFLSTDDPDFGFRRWIHCEPRIKWPTLPAKVVSRSDDSWAVEDAEGDDICRDCSQPDAKVLAFALNWAPRAAALLLKIREGNPMRQWKMKELVALLAEFTPFDMPEGKPPK